MATGRFQSRPSTWSSPSKRRKMAAKVLRTLCKKAKCMEFRCINYSLIGYYHFGAQYRTFSQIDVPSSPRKSRAGFDDYGRDVSNFKPVILEKFNFASDVIDVWAEKERNGERCSSPPAFWFVSQDGKEIKWSFQDLSKESKRTANAFELYCGLKKHDNVLVLLPKIPEFWLINLAAIRTGVILSPGSMMLTSKDLSYRFKAFRPVCIFADEGIADVVDKALETTPCPTLRTKVIVSPRKNRHPGWLDFQVLHESVSSDHECAITRFDESMMVFFTSGTTGMPKMVQHSHGSYGHSLSYTGKYWMDLTSSNIIWNLSDTGWAKTAYGNFFAPWCLGAGVFIHQMPRFDPALVIKVLTEYPIDTLCAPPTAYRLLIQEKLDKKFRMLEHCLSAGEPLNPEVIKQWFSSTGLRIHEGYGQTETILLVGMFMCLEYVAGSIGKPCPGFQIVILDEGGKECGPGKEGQIAVKLKPKPPPGIFKGYMGDTENTLSRLTENYFLTGDVGYYDEKGYYWFVGRSDDVIISAGYRIGPFEVESALMEHPAVVEVAVTSSPDELRGEIVKAFVVLKQGFIVRDEKELIKNLQDHVKTTTAAYKYPRKIELVKDLPKTVSGKIKRFELRNKEWRKSSPTQN